MYKRFEDVGGTENQACECHGWGGYGTITSGDVTDNVTHSICIQCGLPTRWGFVNETIFRGLAWIAGGNSGPGCSSFASCVQCRELSQRWRDMQRYG